MYWDTTTTGEPSSTTPNTVGLTTPQMQGSSAESNMSDFDFTSNWRTTTGYPELSWE